MKVFLKNDSKTTEIEQEIGFREDIPIDKGIMLNEAKLLSYEELIKKYWNFFSVYPDLFLDLLISQNSKFSFYFYQRIFLRASMRFRYHNCTAPRAFSKSFLSILALFMKCVFQPKSKLFICAPKKEQSAKIAKEKITEILDLFPLLKNEIRTSSFGKDYVTIVFKNNSILDVVGALDSTRGGRRHGGLIDEVRDHDGEVLNKVVLPLMNVSRKTVLGTLNEYEPHQSQSYMTSASFKTTFAYQKLIETMQMSIIQPAQSFTWGCDYRVPMMHGLLEKRYLNEIKMSSTYTEESFATEYLSMWLGSSNESWFNYDKISKYRKKINPENNRKYVINSNIFYLLSVDVGRTHDQTIVTVFKVSKKQSGFFSNLVNLYTLSSKTNTKTFEEQAIELKKIIAAFDPQEIVIDGNGLGIGLVDQMITTQIDVMGQEYAPIGVINDKDYLQRQGKNLPQKIYVIKANNALNTKMHGNCFAQVTGGRVKFLISEQDAKARLLESEQGRKMSAQKRLERLLPHQMTTRLLEEMANLKLKRTSTLDIQLEKINYRYPKDKFSSFEMGLWRIKELEDEYTKIKRKNHLIKNRKLVFYN